MNYIELNISVADPEMAEILTAELSELPFESFVAERGALKAYIPQSALVDCKEEADAVLERYGVEQSRYVQIEAQNWNALWESNFEPVDVEGRVLIRAPFHEPNPSAEFEIVIMPKMSFGTGHHATTKMMVEMILRSDFVSRRGLDMGCGTGVLAIAACQRGAEAVDAVDIDDFAYENCCENIATNGVAERICPMLGDVSRVAGRRYDFILANINRNILLGDMAAYVALLAEGGELFVSGFLEADVEAMCRAAEGYGLRLNQSRRIDGWAALSFVK
ncbi:MAG: 50S ribosomal protein L11 methyltransferase [Alistipes sp.]|jgi:ribosomal protein L11 methyltransferase|nr:50S ribosomal protein L11 methyltransferase [Alistipes sp.]